MRYKTLDQIISEHGYLKSASLYNAIVRSIKEGPLRGKAIPLNRNDPQAKFSLPKAVQRSGRDADRDVTNYVILDPQAFEEWFESNKESIRATRPTGRAQVVMPRLEDIQSGRYSHDQLTRFAEHVAGRRYGPQRRGSRAQPAAAPEPKPAAAAPKAKRGRPKSA